MPGTSVAVQGVAAHLRALIRTTLVRGQLRSWLIAQCGAKACGVGWWYGLWRTVLSGAAGGGRDVRLWWYRHNIICDMHSAVDRVIRFQSWDVNGTAAPVSGSAFGTDVGTEVSTEVGTELRLIRLVDTEVPGRARTPSSHQSRKKAQSLPIPTLGNSGESSSHWCMHATLEARHVHGRAGRVGSVRTARGQD